MICCSYCEEENSIQDKNCSFCSAPLRAKRPKLKELIYLELADLPFYELKDFHTYDLLVLLRLLREERSKSYNLMRTIQKAPKEVLVDLNSLRFAEQEYRVYTARMKVIEGILIDRIGYKPKRVDDKLLESLRSKIDNAWKRDFY